jgi:hypothetical protein
VLLQMRARLAVRGARGCVRVRVRVAVCRSLVRVSGGVMTVTVGKVTVGSLPVSVQVLLLVHLWLLRCV